MPTLNINGQSVNVGDDFLSLPPDQQNATVDEIAASLGNKPNVAADVAKSAGIGVVKGGVGMAGMVGDLSELGAKGLDKAVTGLGSLVGQDWSRATNVPNATPIGQSPFGSAAIQKGIESQTGEFYKPQTTAGKYAETVGEFVPGAATGPGGIGRRLLAQALAPGLASEAAGQYTAGTAAEPYARFAGAVGGAFLPGAAARVANPLRPSAERTAAGDVLRNENIPVTAGQETGSNFLKAVESPFGGNQEGQLQALSEAAMRRTGEAGGRATRENIDAAFNRIGQQFDTLAARNNAALDQQFLTDVTGPVTNYRGLVAPPNRAPAIDGYLTEIVNQAQTSGNVLPGNVYQSLRSRIAETARNASRPEETQALRGIQNALDDAMERSIARTNPGDLGGWQEARQQYRNILPIERAITSGGENAALGLLTPGQLSQAVTSVHGRRNRARGQGDFSELADAADALLRPLPNSGTPVRAAAAALPAALGAALGGAAGTVAAPGAGTAIGGITGAALGHALMAGAVNNRASRAYLTGRIPGQNLVANPTSTAIQDALAQALMRARLLGP